MITYDDNVHLQNAKEEPIHDEGLWDSPNVQQMVPLYGNGCFECKERKGHGHSNGGTVRMHGGELHVSFSHCLFHLHSSFYLLHFAPGDFSFPFLYF